MSVNWLGSRPYFWSRSELASVSTLSGSSLSASLAFSAPCWLRMRSTIMALGISTLTPLLPPRMGMLAGSQALGGAREVLSESVDGKVRCDHSLYGEVDHHGTEDERG